MQLARALKCVFKLSVMRLECGNDCDYLRFGSEGATGGPYRICFGASPRRYPTRRLAQHLRHHPSFIPSEAASYSDGGGGGFCGPHWENLAYPGGTTNAEVCILIAAGDAFRVG